MIFFQGFTAYFYYRAYKLSENNYVPAVSKYETIRSDTHLMGQSYQGVPVHFGGIEVNTQEAQEHM